MKVKVGHWITVSWLPGSNVFIHCAYPPGNFICIERADVPDLIVALQAAALADGKDQPVEHAKEQS